MFNGNHIINKVFLEVQVADEKKARQINNNISSFLQTEIFPALEELFSKYSDDRQIIRFDNLDLNLAISDWNDRKTIKSELIKKVEQKLIQNKEQKVNSEIGRNVHLSEYQEFSVGVSEAGSFGNKVIFKESERKGVLHPNENYQATFLFFLEYGYLPWFGKQEYIKEITHPENWQKSVEQKSFQSNLKKILRENQSARNRFVVQFSDEVVINFIGVIDILKLNSNQAFYELLSGSDIIFRTLFLQSILEISLTPESVKHPFLKTVNLELFQKFKPEASVVSSVRKTIKAIQQCFTAETVYKFFQLSENEIDEIEKKISLITKKEGDDFGDSIIENKPTIISNKLDAIKTEKELPFFEKDNNEIVVRNAGLVLLHPFFNTFFKSFNWLDENGRIKDENRFHAVQSLHFVATGNEDFFEANLILEKFLCGVALSSSIPKKSVLSVEVKNEADNLLKEIIRHWPALKNTQADGLRQMFVHRDGKLIQKEKGFKLIVERKVQDILLDNLPWNISIVKLPWKDELLFVEW